MLSVQWPALAALAASLTVAQALLFLFARGLACRVSWQAALLCNALAVAAVAPWLVRDRLMVPAAAAPGKKRPRSVAGFGGGRFGEEIVLVSVRLHPNIRTSLLKRWGGNLEAGAERSFLSGEIRRVMEGGRFAETFRVLGIFAPDA
jgi:hypothetical protein